jgi:hypothetical protein
VNFDFRQGIDAAAHRLRSEAKAQFAFGLENPHPV